VEALQRGEFCTYRHVISPRDRHGLSRGSLPSPFPLATPPPEP
jgi:hypothetical protein